MDVALLSFQVPGVVQVLLLNTVCWQDGCLSRPVQKMLCIDVADVAAWWTCLECVCNVSIQFSMIKCSTSMFDIVLSHDFVV